MSEKSIDTLLKLLNLYKVEIPIVQRDYAQGRLNDHAKMVRQNLLDDMKAAILGKTPPLDLNFVYGKTVSNKFIPLDGQQRLTTLFLLHLYAFYNDDSITKLFINFTYETRKSSRDFLKKLVENRKIIFSSSLPPSEELKDSDWFVFGWIYDPTIQSIMVMLDDIKNVFCDVEDLSQRLSKKSNNPIIFNFLEMKDLGMEDSLYIKLNARGKPLTSLENFKARLIGRLKELQLDLTDEFERYFDQDWTDLFWSSYKEDFDKVYLTFFGVLLMNLGICSNDIKWSDTLDYKRLDSTVFETVYYTLNFLTKNTDYDEVYRIIFNALTDKRTYNDRILFHSVTNYLYLSKGIDNGSLSEWLRIIKNLTLNSQIDTLQLYRRAIDGINKISGNYDNLLEYFSQNGDVSGFSIEQIEEEQIKARIILQSKEYEYEIKKAEQHPYFSGQIRSALVYAIEKDNKFNLNTFKKYWSIISKLFEDSKPKYGNLLRQALLTIGDYTLPVSSYKTLCVDDPDEAASTPSLKRLFSDDRIFVKELLDRIGGNDDIELQLNNIVKDSKVPKNDWRYCLIGQPNIFKRMSVSHLRLREVNGELILVPNKSSNGYNYEIFTSALYELLKQNGIESNFEGDIGTWADRSLNVREYNVKYKNRGFIVKDHMNNLIFESKTDDPITEVFNFLTNNHNNYVITR